MSEKNKNQKLVSYDEFNALISEEGKVNDAVYKSLLEKLKDTAYVTKNGKIRIDKLIADEQFGGVIRNINTQILGKSSLFSKSADEIFDFGNGIVVDEKLGRTLEGGSIKSLDDCVKEMKSGGGKLYYNATEDPDGKKICSVFRKQSAFRFSIMEFDSLRDANAVLEAVPNLKFVFNDFAIHSYLNFGANSVKDVSQLLDRGVESGVIKDLLEDNSDALAKDAFVKFENAGFSCKKTKVQVKEWDEDKNGVVKKTKNKMQFLITDANKLAEYDGGKLKGLLELGIDHFSDGSIKDIAYFLDNGNGIIYDRLDAALRFYRQNTIFDKKVLDELQKAEGCELKQIQTENRLKFEITDANRLINYANGKLKNLLEIGYAMLSDDSVKNVQELLKKGMSSYWISYLLKTQSRSLFAKDAFKGIPGVSFENKKLLITDTNGLKNTEYEFLLNLGDEYYANDSVKNVKELLESGLSDLISHLIHHQSSAFTTNAFKNIPGVSFENKKFLITDANKLAGYNIGMFKSLCHSYYTMDEVRYMYEYFYCDSVKNVKELLENDLGGLIGDLIHYQFSAFTENAFQDIPGVSFENKKFLITDANKLKNTEYKFLLNLGDEYYAKEEDKVVTAKNPELEKDQKQKIDDKNKNESNDNKNKKSDQNITDVKNKIEVNEVKVVEQKGSSNKNLQAPQDMQKGGKVLLNFDNKNKNSGNKNKKSDQNITNVKGKIEVNKVKVVKQKGGSNKNLQAPQDMQKGGKVLLNFDNKNEDSGEENKTSDQSITNVKSKIEVNEVKVVKQEVTFEAKNIDSQIEVEHEIKSPLDHNKITSDAPQNSQKPGNTTNQNSVITTQSTNKMTEIKQQTESKENNGINKFQDIYDIDTYLSKTNFDTTNFKDSLKDVKVNLFDKLCVVIYMFFTHIHTLFGNKNYSVEIHAKLRKAYGKLKNQQQNNHNNTQPVSKQLNSMLISNEQKKTSVCDLFNHLRASAQTKNNNVLLATDNKTEVK